MGGGGKSNRAWGSEGDGPGTPPHRAGSGVYLPKSSTLSLKTSFSMTEHETEPHNSRRNEGYPSFQMQWPLQSLVPGMLESWSHRTLMPMIPALSAPALRATSYIPSPLAHLTPSTYLDQVSTFLLVLPLCLCFSLTTPLCVSSFHSLGLAQFPYHSSSFSLLTCLFVHLSRGFRLSALCMQPCPGPQGTTLSLSLSLSLSHHVLSQA